MKNNRDTDFDFYLKMFKKQHIKYASKELLNELGITDFDAFLTNIWTKSLELFSVPPTILYDYIDDDENIIAYFLGVRYNNIIHI